MTTALNSWSLPYHEKQDQHRQGVFHDFQINRIKPLEVFWNDWILSLLRAHKFWSVWFGVLKILNVPFISECVVFPLPDFKENRSYNKGINEQEISQDTEFNNVTTPHKQMMRPKYGVASLSKERWNIFTKSNS